MGIRYELTRKRHTAPFLYEGTVTSEEQLWQVSAEISEGGIVHATVHSESGPQPHLEERVRLFLRAVWKDSEGNPPTFVRRWRDAT